MPDDTPAYFSVGVTNIVDESGITPEVTVKVTIAIRQGSFMYNGDMDPIDAYAIGQAIINTADPHIRRPVEGEQNAD